MSKGIIVAGFGAIGKTTLQQKYKDVIDMESGMYQWDNVNGCQWGRRSLTHIMKESAIDFLIKKKLTNFN